MTRRWPTPEESGGAQEFAALPEQHRFQIGGTLSDGFVRYPTEVPVNIL